MLTHNKLFYVGKSKKLWKKVTKNVILFLRKFAVNDYVDTFWKLWRLLTDFKGTLRQKKVFGCVYTSNGNNLKIWKPPYLKKDVWSLRSNIFVKTKKFPKLFWPVHMGPRSNLLSKQIGQKSRDTVPLRVQMSMLYLEIIVLPRSLPQELDCYDS